MSEDKDKKNINVEGDVSAGNANFGTQNFYGTVNIHGSISPEASSDRKPHIFISYARADDEPFVERLYHDLKDEFDVWWDRMSMPNRGLTFLQEIRDGIDRADRLLLVAGPRAFTSDYVRDEWLYAYETYKGINIALRLGNYPDLPEQLNGFDAPDFRRDDDYDERLATLKRQLAEPVAPVGQFHNVPALPPHFLNRPEALDALRDLVIADVDKPTLISAEKRTTAVEGMGGIGKSVMATAFAHDRKVRFAFPDGIVWLIAGHKPSMYELYRAVGVALGDDLSNYPDETTALQNAQRTLAGKKCLLILDDVWELPVGRAFRDLISDTSARLLITSRNLQINYMLNANEYRMKLIDEAQAVDYLRSWVRDDPDLETIAEKLGYLFLALKLAGARMKKDGLSGADYLRTFDRVSRMKIDRRASDREDSLEASIMLSMDAAFANAEDEKLLYHSFGIFPEDTPVPQQTILQLWQYLRPDMDKFDLGETLTALVDLALMERNAEDRTITLHDLLHSYTREKLERNSLDMQQKFLESYRVSKLSDVSIRDPYIWEHMIYHLEHAEMWEELIDCLSDDRMLKILNPVAYNLDHDFRLGPTRGRHSSRSDAFKPESIVHLGDRLKLEVGFRLATTFAERAEYAMYKVTNIKQPWKQTIDYWRKHDDQAFLDFRDAIYTFPRLVVLATSFAEVAYKDSPEGREKLRAFCKRYGRWRSFLHLLAHFASGEFGVSGAVEDRASTAYDKWVALEQISHS